ncbi:RHS repeat-associated core domain-containing protein [Fibrobacter sp. UWH9]|uniref:RHS repeat-associated core domain-containing protein n=1 Tax=Fibrobacter sp. UWH9 TaxID=1896213 RepID=UPI001C31512A|nr:RHS repeat-associated core domain-containing protein [Fibrobacter sp. UWH9]
MDAGDVNMPNGLGRYMPEDASAPVVPSTTLDENGKPTDWSVFNPKFEWYLKNHLGSTMLVYGTQGSSNTDIADLGEVKKAYDYRSFGEQIDLIADAGDKVTENFTGKEKDDETELNYFGARYLDPMIGLWISVDPKRQFSSPYLYAGNGYNPIINVDEDGNDLASAVASAPSAFYNLYLAENNAASRGESYAGMVRAGLTAFFTTLGAGFLFAPAGTGGQMAFGAVSAATVEIADQAVAQGKTPDDWDWKEIGLQARNGGILGAIGGATGDLSLNLLNISGEGAGVISGTVGTLETIGFTTAKEAGYIQDEWNSCSDR